MLRLSGIIISTTFYIMRHALVPTASFMDIIRLTQTAKTPLSILNEPGATYEVVWTCEAHVLHVLYCLSDLPEDGQYLHGCFRSDGLPLSNKGQLYYH
jgi:hypothetical protein